MIFNNVYNGIQRSSTDCYINVIYFWCVLIKGLYKHNGYDTTLCTESI